ALSLCHSFSGRGVKHSFSVDFLSGSRISCCRANMIPLFIFMLMTTHFWVTNNLEVRSYLSRPSFAGPLDTLSESLTGLQRPLSCPQRGLPSHVDPKRNILPRLSL